MNQDNWEALIVNTIPAVVAIIALCLIERKALSMGINGKVMITTVALISGLGGYTIKQVKDTIKNF